MCRGRSCGSFSDPTGGCIYYYNPARITSSWIYSRTVMTVIGKHYFAI